MTVEYHKEGEWWVSPYNVIDEVRSTFDLPDKVEVHDATLRDGEQTPGVVFSPEDKVAMAEKMADVGIDRIEAGMPAVSPDDYKAIKQICAMGLDSKIYTFARAMQSDIECAVECGAHGVILEVPIGYPKLKYQFGWTWEDVYKKSAPIINYAKERGLHVVFFPYDTTRAREEDLTNLMDAIMNESPPDSVGVVDTMGCALPEAIKYLVRKMRKETNLPVEIHTHNDFGMGVATELAAVEAGASVVHSCVNGLGERTGNAAMEELVLGLEVLYGIEMNYDMKKFPELFELVSKISNIPIAVNKPVGGSRNFTRESGIGVDLVMTEPLAMFGTHPALTGREGEIVLGKKSGKRSITFNLELMDITDTSDEDVAEMLLRVKELGIKKKTTLTEEEFKEIVIAVLEK
jgi:isopropylmalate/homocitrate/citramalate synthase|tara:strand:- start:1546 stop:2757 length:1212 start_codon:yes stop_codon:yes gene_type:complete